MQLFKRIRDLTFMEEPFGVSRLKEILSRLVIHRRLPGRVEGCVFYLRYKFSNSPYSIQKHGRFRNKSKGTILVDLKKEIGDRYLFQLISFFCFGGYNIQFYTQRSAEHLRDLEYSRLLYTFENFQIVNNLPENTEDKILVFDQDNSDSSNRKWRTMILLNQDVSSNRDKHKRAMIIPYPMHPIIYRLKQHNKLELYRKNEKKVWAIFSGNYGAEYRHSILQDQYNKLSRPQILEIVKCSGIAKVIESQKEIRGLFNGNFRNQFVFIDYEKAVIYQKNWLDSISKSHFFLALPGDVRPMCHNIIEAMAVGAIPITNYPEWFHPRLTHGVNCLVFDSGKALLQRLNDALRMDLERIEYMSHKVIDYYENYLSPASFIKLIESNKDAKVELFIQSGNRDYLSKIRHNSIIISHN